MTKIEDREEIQFRQIPPLWLQDGLPSSQAFKPTKKDEGKLSLDRSALITAKQSFDAFGARGFRSVAVFGLTVGEFHDSAPAPVDCFEDPSADNLYHSYADYTALSRRLMDRKAMTLKQLAMRRGKLHP